MKILTTAVITITCMALQAPAADKETTPEHGKTAARPNQTGFKNIGVQEFEKIRTSEKAVVLDVRTPREFKAGHMPGAVNVDVNAPDFEKKVKALDPSKTYLVHCAAGARGVKACDKLTKLNFGQLYNLEGGFKAWEKAGNKAEKPK